MPGQVLLKESATCVDNSGVEASAVRKRFSQVASPERAQVFGIGPVDGVVLAFKLLDGPGLVGNGLQDDRVGDELVRDDGFLLVKAVVGAGDPAASEVQVCRVDSQSISANQTFTCAAPCVALGNSAIAERALHPVVSMRIRDT